jgi:hypothetical protein
MNTGAHYLSILFIVALVVGAGQPARADAISSVDFTFQPNAQNMNVNAANDFHLSTGLNVVQKPGSTGGFMNDWVAPTKMIDFSQGMVNKGAKLSITITTKFPNPNACGFFTLNMNPVSNQLCGNVLDVTNLAMQGNGSNTNVTFALTDDLGSTVTGSVNVYVDNGFAQDFNQASFDTLDNAQLVFSTTSLDLQSAGSTPLLSLMLGPDQYVLIEGNIDDGDGLGSSPLAIALSPVPEPASLWLLAGNVALLLFGIHRSVRKGGCAKLSSGRMIAQSAVRCIRLDARIICSPAPAPDDYRDPGQVYIRPSRKNTSRQGFCS